MDITFFDENGEPIAYSDDNEHIFLFDGSAVAFISDDSIYDYDGKHLGWFEDGWVRDGNGYCVFFTDEAIGGPMHPMKSMKPMKSLKELKPLKGLKELKPLKSLKSSSWSQQSNVNFFYDK